MAANQEDQAIRVGEVDFTAGFASWLVEKGKSARTVQAYAQDVRVFSRWFEGTYEMPFEPAVTTGVDLRAFREAQLQERVAPATWNRRWTALKVFCRWLMACGLKQFDPFQGVEKVAEEELAPRGLDKLAAARLARQIELNVNGATTGAWRVQAIRDQAMIGLMLYAGLREGDVAGLQVGDVQVGERSGKVIIRRGKGDKHREVPLGREARRCVRLWLEAREACAGEMLFTGKGSAGISTRTIQRRVAEVGRQCGLVVTPHDLRHTFALATLRKEGVTLADVQKLLGHSRLETTGRYLKPSWKDLERAVE